MKRRRAPRELRPPRPEAYAALGPYARGRLEQKALGKTLILDVPYDVFASQAIDDGTLLLLRNLPERDPGSVLDLGCGYGALGLPVALRWPHAKCVLIDRDLLAVRAATHNARANGAANAEVKAALGYRALEAERFDWVLCNMPARIGREAIRYLLEGGRALGAEVRAVVIRDLSATVEALPLAGIRRVARGARHDVFSLLPAEARVDLADVGVYARDHTRFEGMPLARPHDASEDPEHLPRLRLLAESLPRAAPRRALSFRAGYGAVPLLLRSRYPSTEVVAQERDLLETAFLRRNAAALGLSVDVREALFPSEACAPASCDLVVGELSSPAGAAVAARELRDAAELLSTRGEALILATAKQEREWLPQSRLEGASLAVLLRREGASVLRISRAERR